MIRHLLLDLFCFIKLRNTGLLSVVIPLYGGLLIFLLLTNYNYVWTQPEEFNWRVPILADGTRLNAHDLLSSFDFQTFEFKPRSTRPLSSLVEIIDTKFRVWLWQFIVPHPSLSITWILLLLIGPYVFYKFLRAIGIARSVAIIISTLYVTNPATLSLVAVNFRPSKPIANFTILLCLYIASLINKKSIAADNNINPRTKTEMKFFIMCMVMLVSFFFDETALVAYWAVPLFFPRVVFGRLKRIAAYGLIPIVTCCCYYKFFPLLSKLAGYSGSGLAHVAEHSPLLNTSVGNSTIISTISSVITTLWKLIAADLGTNIMIFLSDSMGLVNPALSKSPLYQFLWAGTVLLLVLMLVVTVIKLLPIISKGRLIFKRPHYSIVSASTIALASVTVFANILLHLVDNHIWGLHWLSTFWAIFYYILVALILNKCKYNFTLIAVMSFFIMSTSFYNFVYVNNAFKKFYYYRSVDIWDIWRHKANRFQIPVDKGIVNYKLTRYIWKEQGKHSVIQHIPTELYYLVHDLMLIAPGTSYAQRFSVFDGHILTFSLIKPDRPNNHYFIALPEK